MTPPSTSPGSFAQRGHRRVASPPGWLILGVLASAVVTLGVAPAAQVDDALDRVGHIVVLYEENHSFDNYFGHFPVPRALRMPGPLLSR